MRRERAGRGAAQVVRFLLPGLVLGFGLLVLCLGLGCLTCELFIRLLSSSSPSSCSSSLFFSGGREEACFVLTQGCRKQKHISSLSLFSASSALYAILLCMPRNKRMQLRAPALPSFPLNPATMRSPGDLAPPSLSHTRIQG